MLHTIKQIFSFGRNPGYKRLLAEGACIIDVRTRKEFANGHIEGSINIPLNELREGLSKIERCKVIITCCASGMRSASARNVLLTMGYSRVYNGGPYMKLQKSLK